MGGESITPTTMARTQALPLLCWCATVGTVLLFMASPILISYLCYASNGATTPETGLWSDGDYGYCGTRIWLLFLTVPIGIVALIVLAVKRMIKRGNNNNNNDSSYLRMDEPVV